MILLGCNVMVSKCYVLYATRSAKFEPAVYKVVVNGSSGAKEVEVVPKRLGSEP